MFARLWHISRVSCSTTDPTHSLAVHPGLVAAFTVSVFVLAANVSDVFTSVRSRWIVDTSPVLPSADVAAAVIVGAFVCLGASIAAFTEFEHLTAVCVGPSGERVFIWMVVAFLWVKRKKPLVNTLKIYMQVLNAQLVITFDFLFLEC